jgi:predicted O-linked N-acetylglucosamine transferase (SPINDLY family)
MARTAGRKQKRTNGAAAAPQGNAKAAVAVLLQAGLKCHGQGDLPGAAGHYNEVLKHYPRQPDALHLLGVACLQTGRLDEAVDLIGRAVAENPGQADYHGNLSAALLRLNRDEEAVAAAGKAVELQPRNPGFQGNLAVALKRVGRQGDAADAFRQLLALDPSQTRLHKEIADLASGAKRYDLAIEHYRAHLAAFPDDPDIPVAWNNLAYALEQRGQLDEAQELYRRALEACPDDPDYINNVGLICRMLGEYEAAETHLRRAVALMPENHKFVANLASLLADTGRFDEAAGLLEQRCADYPDNADLLMSLGTLYKNLGEDQKARETFQRAVEVAPRNPDAYRELAIAYVQTNDTLKAYDTLKRILEFDPQYVPAHLLLTEACGHLKRPDEADIRAQATLLLPNYLPQNCAYPMKAFRNACDFDGLDKLGDIFAVLDTAPIQLYAMAFLHLLVMADDVEQTRRLVELHRRWGDWAIRRADRSPLPPFPAKRRGGKIRIGFLSSDLNSHSVATCLMPLLENYDRERFEIYCYSPRNIAGDPIQAKIQRLVTKYQFLVNQPDLEFARTIRADEVDILFELNGITQHSRTTVTAYKPAPVQISYLGYPFTFGVGRIDYMLLDRYLAPERDDLLVEKPLVMPGSWICFTSMGECDVNPEPPSATTGYVTFGTLNNPYKFTRETVALWAEVMRNVPNSRFLMVRRIDSSTLRCHHLIEEFGRHGVTADRLFFKHNRDTHLPSYHEIDLSLDTFPLTGGNTTADALWMGVPVVTLRGPSYHQRISHAIVSHAGLGDLSAGTREEFVQKAVALANDVERRRQIRGGLRRQLLESDMFRGDRFVPAFQETMLQLVERHGLR